MPPFFRCVKSFNGLCVYLCCHVLVYICVIETNTIVTCFCSYFGHNMLCVAAWFEGLVFTRFLWCSTDQMMIVTIAVNKIFFTERSTFSIRHFIFVSVLHQISYVVLCEFVFERFSHDNFVNNFSVKTHWWFIVSDWIISVRAKLHTHRQTHTHTHTHTHTQTDR